jgi:hypothetical protein
MFLKKTVPEGQPGRLAKWDQEQVKTVTPQ